MKSTIISIFLTLLLTGCISSTPLILHHRAPDDIASIAILNANSHVELSYAVRIKYVDGVPVNNSSTVQVEAGEHTISYVIDDSYNNGRDTTFKFAVVDKGDIVLDFEGGYRYDFGTRGRTHVVEIKRKRAIQKI